MFSVWRQWSPPSRCICNDSQGAHKDVCTEPARGRGAMISSEAAPRSVHCTHKRHTRWTESHTGNMPQACRDRARTWDVRGCQTTHRNTHSQHTPHTHNAHTTHNTWAIHTSSITIYNARTAPTSPTQHPRKTHTAYTMPTGYTRTIHITHTQCTQNICRCNTQSVHNTYIQHAYTTYTTHLNTHRHTHTIPE